MTGSRRPAWAGAEVPPGTATGGTIMNAPLRIAELSLSVLGLAACAGSQTRSSYVQPERVLKPGEVRIERDAAYIAYVERVARRRGIYLQWVNPPVKRVTNE
jgi:N-acetylglucosamine kinase-like BadF-type ATPase